MFSQKLSAVFIPVIFVSSETFHLHGDDPGACAATAERDKTVIECVGCPHKSAWFAFVCNFTGNMEHVLVSMHIRVCVTRGAIRTGCVAINVVSCAAAPHLPICLQR